jgi:hypothetical protein
VVTGWESRLATITWECFYKKNDEAKYDVMMEHPTVLPFLWSYLSDGLTETSQNFFHRMLN